MATVYQGMEEYTQTRTLLNEAVRLHLRHPVVLAIMATMAEVLCELEYFSEAMPYIDRPLEIRACT